MSYPLPSVIMFARKRYRAEWLFAFFTCSIGGSSAASGQSSSRSSSLRILPLPQKLPKHSWESASHKVFIHGCKTGGLFNASELALAAKYPLLTVEKGQGLDLPGYAESKMAALSKQYKSARPDGWAMFYMNAQKDWNMYHMHQVMLEKKAFCVTNSTGQCCHKRGDPSFPQPDIGMLLFNMSNPGMRAMFRDTCVHATTPEGGDFDGCFIDSADSWGPTKPITKDLDDQGLDLGSGDCDITAEEQGHLAMGLKTMLTELQEAVTENRMVIAKDSDGRYTDTKYVNSIFMSDTYCCCYQCTWSKTLGDMCVQQISDATAIAKTGQVVLVHGETNLLAPETDTEVFQFTFAAFLIAAQDTTFFGYSKQWYYNGTKWWTEYDRPLGSPVADASIVSPGVYTRTFSSGTVVTLDVYNHTSHIAWKTTRTAAEDVML